VSANSMSARGQKKKGGPSGRSSRSHPQRTVLPRPEAVRVPHFPRRAVLQDDAARAALPKEPAPRVRDAVEVHMVAEGHERPRALVAALQLFAAGGGFACEVDVPASLVCHL
jgi:hypothetical protein